nr:MAG TPA: zinc-ribbon containing domain protein [Caudoviricetes sp.]
MAINSVIENVAISLLAPAREEVAKAQEKEVLARALQEIGIDAKAFKKMPAPAREGILASYSGIWEESQKGEGFKKCPYCGKFHNGENIPCDSCSPVIIETVHNYAEYEKSLKGDYAVQNAQWLRKDLDFLYAERDAREISSREGNITKIARVLVSMYESMDEGQKSAFWENVKNAVVSNSEKPNEAGFENYLKNNK